MYTIGQSTLAAIRANLTDTAIIAKWDMHPRITGYVAEVNEPSIVELLISPHALLFTEVRAGGPGTATPVIDVILQFPVGGTAEDPSVLTPDRWATIADNLTAPGTGVSLTDFMQLVQTGTFLTAFYQIPRGLEADRVRVPTNNGLLYYATDSKKLYIYINGWQLISQPIPAADLGIMFGFSDALPVPSSQYLRCDGSTVPIVSYPDLFNVFTQNGTQPSPFATGTEPATLFTLPLQANTIIRALF